MFRDSNFLKIREPETRKPWHAANDFSGGVLPFMRDLTVAVVPILRIAKDFVAERAVVLFKLRSSPATVIGSRGGTIA